MHVKLEPTDHLELPVNLITDIETDLFREQLFGNPIVSNSDISESSSDDDHLSKLSLSPYETLGDSFGMEQLPSSLWEPRSSRSSSSSGSLDHVFTDMESQPNSFSDFNNDDLDIESATCSPHDVIMSPIDMKEELFPSSSEMDSSSLTVPLSDSNSIWDLLYASDIKPNIKVLDTPPVTPPESSFHLGDSPPTSPPETFTSCGPPSPPASVIPSTRVITVTSVNPTSQSAPAPPKKKITLAPKIPFKIVTTITANENNNNTGNRRTIKIQPKSASFCKPTINVGNSSVPKFTEVKAVSERTLLKANKQLVQKPVVISTVPSSPHTAPVSTTLSIPSAASVTTCTVIPDQKPVRLPPIAPALNPSIKNNSMAELRAMKRQQRMIKNRESASLSRKRKKEYLQGLEDKVRELELANAKLRVENERLLRRVTSLENEKVIMKAARFPIKRSSTALLGFAFLLLFNVSPMMNLFQRKSNVFPGEPWRSDVSKSGINPLEEEATFHRRSLLSLPSVEDITGTQMDEQAPHSNISYICPVNFNSTESIRIENDLRDLFDSNKKDWPSGNKARNVDNNAVFHPKTNEGRKSGKKKDGGKERGEGEGRALAAPLTSVVSSAAYQYLYHSNEDTDPVQKRKVFDQHLSQDLMSLLETIDRRNDTYYVVSLTADHLLLPASAHNTSARPKMSLLFPTPKALSEHDDHIGIMQIDCEVTHTRVVRWTHFPEVPSVQSSDVLPEAPINTTDPKRSLRREKIPLKKKKRKKV